VSPPNRTLEARHSTPLRSTENPIDDNRRGFVFLGLDFGLWNRCVTELGTRRTGSNAWAGLGYRYSLTS